MDYSERIWKTYVTRRNDWALPASSRRCVTTCANRFRFKANTFDACFSHMLYCMAPTTAELETLFEETRRALKPGGLNLYTARNTHDPDYGAGIQRGEDMYEDEGFIVHYFSRNKVERLALGYQLLDIEEFEESKLAETALPRHTEEARETTGQKERRMTRLLRRMPGEKAAYSSTWVKPQAPAAPE